MKKGETKKLLVLLTGFTVYLIFGAIIFKAVEDNRNTGETNMEQIFRKYRSKKNLTRTEFDSFVRDVQLVYQTTNYGSTWTFYSSLYFCGSVVTTIGYGHMTPKTDTGRIILMFYAIIGIPLNLWTLKAMGDAMTSLLSNLISKFEKVVLRRPEQKHIKLKVVAAMAILNIMILFLGGIMYMVSEGWSYVEGVYYCFIVYSTIGFGDLVPNEGHEVISKNEIFMMFIRALNLMIGLSLLSSLLSSIIQAADELKVVIPQMKIHPLQKLQERLKGKNKVHAKIVRVTEKEPGEEAKPNRNEEEERKDVTAM